MRHSVQRANAESGFTLVELAIVLVIIGLIIGGVLVGQDLIKAAEIRSTIGQVEKYNAAVNTFRTKYNGLPGDLRNPGLFGLASTGATGSGGRADGDGLIESGACSDLYGFGGETALFWNHLNTATLIDGSTTAITDYAAVAAVTIDDTHLPGAKIGRGNRFHVASFAGLNYFMMANFTATTVTTCALTAADALTPQEGFQIDSKIDDSVPSTGTVISVASAASPTAAGGGASNPAAADCYDSDAPIHYAMDDADSSNVLGCQLRIRSSF